jgi:hypothetical protein
MFGELNDGLDFLRFPCWTDHQCWSAASEVSSCIQGEMEDGSVRSATASTLIIINVSE